MHIGQWIVGSNASGVTPVEIYSPWFPRGADNAIFTMEVIADVNPAGTNKLGLDVDVFEKNTEDVGDGAVVSGSTFSTMNTVGFYKTPVIEGLKELVRFKYSFAPTGTGVIVAAALYRMLPPTWFSDASA